MVGLMRTSGELTTQQKWSQLVRQHEQSGAAVKVFCRERGVSEPSFYSWRKRLGSAEPVRFALVDASPSRPNENAPVELILPSGDRLKVASGVDAATLRTVLSVLRERA
jgi:transposase-like protein